MNPLTLSTKTTPLATAASGSTAQTGGTPGWGLGNFASNALAGRADLGFSNPNQPAAPQMPQAAPTTIVPSSKGGINFAGATSNPPAQFNASATIGSDASRSYQTPNGANVQLNPDGSIGKTTSAQGYSIDTSGAFPSSALASNVGANDIANAHSQYSDYVNALSHAQGYSPDYISALQNQYQAQGAGAALNLNAANINSRLATGQGFTGFTTGQAQTQTGIEQAQNSLNQGVNQIAQLSANQALNTQALSRTGNIAAAQTQLQYSPVGMAGQNALNQYNSLQTQFPDAKIPSYNASLSPAENQQIAQEAAAQSPSFQARNLVQISLPGGGVSFINKNQIATNPATGQTSIISPANAAQAEGYQKSISDLTSQASNIGSSIATADNNFPLLLTQLKGAGINDFGSPLANQIERNTTAKVNGSQASFNALVQSLQTTYSAILSRGGSVTNETRDEANRLVNGSLSYNDMQKLYKTLKQESTGVLKGIEDTKQQQIQGLNTIYGQGQPLSSFSNQGASSGGSGGIYDF